MTQAPERAAGPYFQPNAQRAWADIPEQELQAMTNCMSIAVASYNNLAGAMPAYSSYSDIENGRRAAAELRRRHP